MKFVFYYDGKKKKKEQVIKTKTNDDLMLVAKIAKCEITKTQILKDLDFSEVLMCKVDDKKLTMYELWNFLNKKFKLSENVKSKNKKKKKDKSKDKKQKSSNDMKKKSKKNKKKIKKTNSPVTNTKSTATKPNGLISITRKNNIN